jgi:hypothetical protein
MKCESSSANANEQLLEKSHSFLFGAFSFSLLQCIQPSMRKEDAYSLCVDADADAAVVADSDVFSALLRLAIRATIALTKRSPPIAPPTAPAIVATFAFDLSTAESESPLEVPLALVDDRGIVVVVVVEHFALSKLAVLRAYRSSAPSLTSSLESD